MCNFSGIENENEIYSCAQLEATQTQQSKTVEEPSSVEASSRAPTETSDTTTTTTSPKVVKRDNIVLGISDLKQQQQRKSSIENSKGGKGASKPIIVDKIEITPITTIKVNNFEIISRPRSVTASIFEHPTILTHSKPRLKQGIETKLPSIKKVEATQQIYRPLLQCSPTSVTSSIFAPRTKDMNPGYLMFTEDTDTGLTSE